jgi:2'-5' RNA ligase
MDFGDSHLIRLYDALWQDAVEHFAKGRVQLDSHLVAPHRDHRLGLTVIARPTQQVIDQFSALLRELAQIEPHQYFYQPSEFHITILSLFTATENFEPYFAKIPAYLTTLQPVLSASEQFTVRFRGITATKSSIMVQGFPQDGKLERLRDRLRKALQSKNLGEGLDERYRITTAHTTIMRFRTQPQDLKRLIRVLGSYREYSFGQSTFQTLQLVKNDWYMSADKVEVLADYPLL